jgi:hypothetical protein
MPAQKKSSPDPISKKPLQNKTKNQKKPVLEWLKVVSLPEALSSNPRAFTKKKKKEREQAK